MPPFSRLLSLAMRDLMLLPSSGAPRLQEELPVWSAEQAVAWTRPFLTGSAALRKPSSGAMGPSCFQSRLPVPQTDLLTHPHSPPPAPPPPMQGFQLKHKVWYLCRRGGGGAAGGRELALQKKTSPCFGWEGAASFGRGALAVRAPRPSGPQPVLTLPHQHPSGTRASHQCCTNALAMMCCHQALCQLSVPRTGLACGPGGVH